MTVSVVFQGFQNLQDRIREVQEAFNTQDLLDTAGAYLLNRVRESFLAAENPDGTPWPESAAFLARQAAGRGGKTGFDTGDLFRSITLARLGDQRVIFSEIPYADEFQDGPPERLIFDFTEEDEAAINRILEARLRDALR